MKLLYLFLFLSFFSYSQINLIGFPKSTVIKEMTKKGFVLESEKPFQDQGTMLTYNDPKRPLKYVYLIKKTDNSCFGFTVTALKIHASHMLQLINKTNGNFEQIAPDRWIETRGTEKYTWWLTETRDKTLDVMIIKKRQ